MMNRLSGILLLSYDCIDCFRIGGPSLKKNFSLLRLFYHSLLLSAFTFGGGYVIVPLMKGRFVEDLGWLKEDEMMNLIAIGQSAPGPVAINSSIIVGHQLAGLKGALVATLGTTLPPLLIMTIVSYIYLAIRDNVWVQNIMTGMQAGIAAIILSVVIDLILQLIRTKNKVLISMMVIGLILALVFNVNAIYLLVAAALFSLAIAMHEGRREE